MSFALPALLCDPAFSHSYIHTLFVCTLCPKWMASISPRHVLYSWHRGKQRGRTELKEGASAFLHHSGTPVTNQPPLPSSPSLLSLLQENKMRSNSVRELMPARTRPDYHLLPQALVSSFTCRFIYKCSHHHDSELFVFCVDTCLCGTLLPVMTCTGLQRIFYHNISCVKYSGFKVLTV